MYRKLELQYMQWEHSEVLQQVVLSEKFLNQEYGTHKMQAMIFWGCIQGMNQQKFVTILLNISIRVNHFYDSALWNLLVLERE